MERVKLRVRVSVKSHKDGMDYTGLDVIHCENQKYDRDHYRIKGQNALEFKKEYDILVKFYFGKTGKRMVAEYSLLTI